MRIAFFANMETKNRIVKQFKHVDTIIHNVNGDVVLHDNDFEIIAIIGTDEYDYYSIYNE